MKNKLDGALFSQMVQNGYQCLLRYEKEINAMNVFPAADGDTGSNMRLTLEKGISNAPATSHLGEYLAGLSKGMLLGARGNSGVILSQLFKGMYTSLSQMESAGPVELANAMICAHITAYHAVLQPVEGTILTVAREGIENIKLHISAKTELADLFSLYLSEMSKSLAATPQLLPVLKNAGVLDSGAFGYVKIVEGMLQTLTGEAPAEIVIPDAYIAGNAGQNGAVSFGEDSVLVDGYCMEFLLQLTNAKHYKETFRREDFMEELGKLGESIVVIQEDSVVKVHIHTFSPAPVIALSQTFGEFVSFKLENMTLQHNELEQGPANAQLPHKKIGLIAVVDGEGVEPLFRDGGCDIVLQGGKNMNPSSGEFRTALEQLNADIAIVLPNNINSVESANQAVRLFGKDAVVLPTKNVMEGYFALSMDVGDSEDADYRVEAMRDGMQSVTVLTCFTAVKDYESERFCCTAGEIVSALNGELVAAGNSMAEALVAGIEKVEGLEEKSGFLVFLGKDAKDLEEQISAALSGAFADKDIQIVYGGQSIYSVMVGVI